MYEFLIHSVPHLTLPISISSRPLPRCWAPTAWPSATICGRSGMQSTLSAVGLRDSGSAEASSHQGPRALPVCAPSAHCASGTSATRAISSCMAPSGLPRWVSVRCARFARDSSVFTARCRVRRPRSSPSRSVWTAVVRLALSARLRRDASARNASVSAGGTIHNSSGEFDSPTPPSAESSARGRLVPWSGRALAAGGRLIRFPSDPWRCALSRRAQESSDVLRVEKRDSVVRTERLHKVGLF